MEYLKVFTDFVKVMEPLGDAERGRLFTAMLEYADSSSSSSEGFGVRLRAYLAIVSLLSVN